MKRKGRSTVRDSERESYRKNVLEKVPTGIQGLDEITGGGLPKGRPTLVAGSAGSGKTLLGMEFLVRGILQFNEPGAFVTFEERVPDLEKNFASLGFDLAKLQAQKKIALDHVWIERSEIEETGEYDLEGLFIRLEHAVATVKAKRIVLDTIEALFSGLSNTTILRAELRRLFYWIKTKGLTAVVTGEQGQTTLTRYGLEEYVADCVIALDHRVINQISTRRLRILKYRGSAHGTNEYPFLIGETGLSVLPITSIGLDYGVSTERISSGIARLDAILGRKGFYRGSSILVSGTAGTGKTTVASTFCEAACRRGEKCLYFSFEESDKQIARNMKSIGLDLGQWVKKNLLMFHNIRPSLQGLEMHLVMIHNLVNKTTPSVVIIDPITALPSVGAENEVKSMLSRLIDFLKSKGITSLFTDLSHGDTLETTSTAISSLIDSWIVLRDIEIGGERNRGLYVIKSRGMQHSNQIREFILTRQGIKLIDVYMGPAGVLTGSARVVRETEEQAAKTLRQQDIERKKRDLEHKQKLLQAQIEALTNQHEVDTVELKTFVAEAEMREAVLEKGRAAMAERRRLQEE